MQRMKTSGAINRVLSIIIVGVITALSMQSVAQESNLSALPPIESIDAKTDIRGFLLPDVPRVLHVAALRRTWLVNPAIRDFREMAENDWDFTATGGVLGFGPLDPDFDSQAMVAEMLSTPGLTVAGQSRQPSATQIVRAGFWSGIFVR